jgi:hypothetical protein
MIEANLFPALNHSHKTNHRVLALAKLEIHFSYCEIGRAQSYFVFTEAEILSQRSATVLWRRRK